MLSTSTGARAQPLMLAISTAGYDRHSILWELYAHAKKVQARPGARSVVSADHLSRRPTTPTGRTSASGSRRTRRWAISARSRKCATACARAKEIPAQENNVPPAVSEPVDRAGVALDRAGGLGRLPGADRSRARSRAGAATSGWTCSTTTDLTALVAVFPDDDGFDVLRRSSSCPPSGSAQRVDARSCARTTNGRARACSTATPGAVVDYDAVRAAAAGLGRRNSRCGWSPSIRGTRPTWSSRLRAADGFACVEDAPGVRVAVGADQVARAGDPRRARCATTGTRCCAGTSATSPSKPTRPGNLKPVKDDVDRTDRRRRTR